ncbi:MAG: cell envelope biogenesis protein TonB [Gammaproteobacteria bacterium]|nr:MAG: cell envelope biogenesis protein TonB [Gammaproteobacteria bacterium]
MEQPLSHPPEPRIGPADRLSLTLFLAGAAHALLILGLAFEPPDPARLDAPPALEIILVQKRDARSPDEADYLAQIDQSGGGERDHRARPANPFTSTELSPHEGVAPQPLHGGRPEPPAEARERLIAQPRPAETQVPVDPQPRRRPSPTPGDPLLDYDLQIARLTAELELAREQYAKRPRKMVVTANTKAYLPAAYMQAWVERVERIGNLNYPEEARRRGLEGTLILEVELDRDGSIVEVNLLQSSGSPVLDEAARRIVHLAAPYPPFPEALREVTDRLEIVRTWQFSAGGLNTW